MQGGEQWHADRCGKITSSRFSDVLAYTTDRNRPSITPKWCRDRVAEVQANTIHIPGWMMPSQVMELEEALRAAPELKPAERDDGIISAWLDDWCSQIVSTGARDSYIQEIVAERLYGVAAIDQFETFAMRRGKELEPEARAILELDRNLFIDEVDFVQHPDLPYVGASPDGLVADDVDGESAGVEIKCPMNPVRHLRCFHEGMPAEHIGQVQGNLWVTNRDFWYFVSYDPRPENRKLRLYVERVYRDERYINRLEEACELFNEEVEEACSRILAKAEAIAA